MAAALLYCASTAAAPITLTGDYIKIGTNDVGTLGSGNNTSPGILYDNTGTGTFNTAYDYLTPGTPFEGFAITSASGGSTYAVTSNNSGLAMTAGLAGTLANSSSGSYQGVTWTGSYTTGGNKLYDIVNAVGFNTSDKKITITSTITAAQNLSDIYFARYTDPDARAASGDSSATNNFRGNGTVPATNLVYAEALVSKYVIGLYSAAASGVNTGISSGWSTVPTVYYTGTDDGNGDYVIGIAYYTASLTVGDSVTYTYYYIFGADIAAAIEDSVGGVSVLGSSTALGNQPAYGAAAVIDNTPALLSLFTGASLSGDQEISNAASQTLPLLTGGSMIAAGNALSGINHIIQARIESNLGLSSGDDFLGDRKFWLKPFGSWADQNDRNGVAGFKADTWGVALGADAALNNRTRLGAAFAYANSNVDSNSAVAPQTVDVNVYQLIGYGSYSLAEDTELNFQVNAGQNKNKGNRSITFAGTVASAEYDSYTAHAGVGLGRTYPLSETTRITPSVRADYTWIKDKSYSETGAGLLNLDVASRSTEELVLSIDGKLTHALSDHTTLTANLGAGYDVINEQASITAAFAGAPGASFVTNGLDPSPWIGRGGLGLVHDLKNSTEITARYDVEARENFTNQTASIKARWAF
jgi:outer membrane autotransporter protein